MTFTHEAQVMLVLLVSGFLLLGVGFHFRDKGVGIAIMMAGAVVLLGTVAVRIIKAVSI